MYSLFSYLLIALSILVFITILSCAMPEGNAARHEPSGSMAPADNGPLLRNNSIRLDSPVPGAVISSPHTLRGKARGTWFFEGDFPVMLLDAQGNKIAERYATAYGEWMTEDFVEFEGVIHFNNAPSGQSGILVLKKDNPTGLEKIDDDLRVPVTFQ